MKNINKINDKNDKNNKKINTIIPNSVHSLELQVKSLSKHYIKLLDTINNISYIILSGKGNLNVDTIKSSYTTSKFINTKLLDSDIINIKNSSSSTGYIELKEYINNAIQSGGDPDKPIINSYGLYIKKDGNTVISLDNEGKINTKSIIISDDATLSGNLNINDSKIILKNNNTETITINSLDSSIKSDTINVKSGILSNVIQDDDNSKVIVNKEYVDKKLFDNTKTLNLIESVDSLYTQGNVKIGYVSGQTSDPAIYLNSNGIIEGKSILLKDSIIIGNNNGILIESNEFENSISNVSKIYASDVDETDNNSVINLNYLQNYVIKNNGNYYVQKITNSLDPSDLNDKDLILYNNNNNYTLKQYINNDNTFINYEVSNGSSCFIKDVHTLFFKDADNWYEIQSSSPHDNLILDVNTNDDDF